MEARTILLIEDDLELCKSIHFALTRAGFKVNVSTEARDASFRIKNQAYFCILLDMRLGNSSGEDLITVIRDRKDGLNKSTPILVISGHLDRPLMASISAQIQGALVKPFEVSTLIDRIKSVTQARNTG